MNEARITECCTSGFWSREGEDDQDEDGWRTLEKTCMGEKGIENWKTGEKL